MVNKVLGTMQALNRQWAALRPAAWLGARVMHHLDRLVYNVSGGQHTAVNLLFGLPIITLTTTGARSGLPRTVPLIGVPYGRNIILVGTNWGQKHHPAWYHNLIANPRVKVSVSGSESHYMARPTFGIEREQCWNKAVDSYGGYKAYEERTGGREIPVILLTPLKETS